MELSHRERGRTLGATRVNLPISLTANLDREGMGLSEPTAHEGLTLSPPLPLEQLTADLETVVSGQSPCGGLGFCTIDGVGYLRLSTAALT